MVIPAVSRQRSEDGSERGTDPGRDGPTPNHTIHHRNPERYRRQEVASRAHGGDSGDLSETFLPLLRMPSLPSEGHLGDLSHKGDKSPHGADVSRRLGRGVGVWDPFQQIERNTASFLTRGG